MRFQIWNSAFNALMMLFWFRLWNRDNRAVFFNPHLSALERLSDAMLTFIRPMFMGIPGRMIPAILLVFLLVLRALIIALGAPLGLSLGFQHAEPQHANVLSCLLFSILSFAIFLFTLWSLSLLYTRTRFSAQSDHALNAVDSLARPFSSIRAEIRPPVILLAGIILATVLMLADSAGPGPSLFAEWSPVKLGLRLTLSALAGCTNVLMVVHSFAILLIIGSWVSMFTGSPPMVTFCNEWLNFFMGPLRRYPIVIGMFNITPLVFMFAVGLLHNALIGFLSHAYVAAQ